MRTSDTSDTDPGSNGIGPAADLPASPSVESLAGSPNALAPFYGRFRVAERLLLTGHSHQAWPDVAFEAQQRAWLDAAEHVDDKWERAFEVANRVRRGFANLLDDDTGSITLGGSTHDLVVRFLSALSLQRRPRLLTTDGEYHSLRRQLRRLAEEGVDVERLPSDPAADVGERLATAVDDRTAAAMVSSVFFRRGHIAGGLGQLAAACERFGARLLVDAYHSLAVVPFSLPRGGLESAYVVGGGYKYCQLGEGNCFLRTPSGCDLRPVITGWFSEFGMLQAADDEGAVRYGEGPLRFAGATYDPVSHYRAAAVFAFFEERGLTPAFLRRVSQHQVGRIARRFDALGLDPAIVERDRGVDLASVGGFLAMESPHAAEICSSLRTRGIYIDCRDTTLRFGPAPYLCDDQLDEAVDSLRCFRR